MVELEHDTSTEGLLDYLNPSSAQVDTAEVVNAAMLIHWVRNDPEHQRIRIEAGADGLRRILGPPARAVGPGRRTRQVSPNTRVLDAIPLMQGAIAVPA